MPAPSSRSHPLTRRSVLLGGAGLVGAAFLAACGDDGDTGGGTDAGGSPQLILSPLFPAQGLAEAGAEQRLPFTLSDAQGLPLEDAPGMIDLTISNDDGPLETVSVEGLGEGLATTYYPLRFTFPAPGFYEVEPTVDGTALPPIGLEAGPAGSVAIPGPGDAMIAVDTPTVDDPHGVDPICTRDPVCDLHEVTLTEALDEGRPVALLVATPAFCQTAVCGPVLDILLERVPDHPDVRFVHAEVYADPEAVDNIAQATVAPAPEAYGLPFEPALFLADASGTVVERIDTIYGTEELESALTALEQA